MESGGAWKGDWKQRILDRVAALEFDSVDAFASAYPTLTFLELAALLGPDVAAIQLELLQCERAERVGQLNAFARSCLVRRIRQELPGGWGRPESAEYARASAFAAWSTTLGQAHDEATMEAWEVAKSLDIPADWLPSGPDDEYILRIVGTIGE